MFLRHMFSKLWINFNLLIKTIIDIIGSLFLIIILLPLLIVISIMIKLGSKGPIIFKQNRLTKKGKTFKLYKFRTMVNNAEQIGTGLFSYEGDPRITKLGSFLRKSSLDELPQLFNIITLKMSFVGPRPPVDYELGKYEDLSIEYKRRFRMKAGITGLAQTSGRNELDWDLKVKKDNEYIEKFNKIGFLLDIIIVFKTVMKIFKTSNINETEPEYLKNLTPEEKKEYMMNEVNNKARGKDNE